MEMQTWEVVKKSLLSGDLVMTAVIGGLLAVGGVLLFGQERVKIHTVPPIIIKSVEGGSDPIEIESEQQLAEARKLDRKVDYKVNGFGVTKSIVIDLRNGDDWVRYGFGRRVGLEVRLTFQVKEHGSWVDETEGAPQIFIDGRTADFPLTTEELSADSDPHHGHFKHRRAYKNNVKRRIGEVKVEGFPLSPLSTRDINEVQVGFFNH